MQSHPEDRRGEVTYFVRDDDIGPLTDSLKRFVETFASNAIPVSYQIIPARLTPECAEYLIAARRAHPELVEFGQHGLRHGMRVGRRELNREFGPERSYDQQLGDIGSGLELLHSHLGSITPIEVFTPPQHKFNRDTVLAAAAVGHQTFSAACYPSLHHQLAYGLGRNLNLSSYLHHGVSHHGRMRPEAKIFELSIAVAVDDGRARRVGSEMIGSALETATRMSPIVGAMFHHAVYEDFEGRRDLAVIAARLSARGAGSFGLLGQLARSRR